MQCGAESQLDLLELLIFLGKFWIAYRYQLDIVELDYTRMETVEKEKGLALVSNPVSVAYRTAP